MKQLPTVLLEVSKAAYPFNGLGNYCSLLGQTVQQQANCLLQPVFYLPKSIGRIFGESAHYAGMHRYHRWLSALSPLADVWHLTHQDSPYLPPRRNIPLLLTVHDLNYLRTNKSQQRIRQRHEALRCKLARAQMITVISEFTKHELLEHFPLKVPVKVIYNGVNVVAASATKPDYVPSSPYLLALGEITTKKNFHVLLPLLQCQPELKIIIAGSTHDGYANYIKQHAQELNLADRVIMPGKVGESEKSYLYQHCLAFLFPSLAEGFGLPVIEAMRFGKPVFLANSTSLPEIGGEFAYYFENFAPEYMQAVFNQGMRDCMNHPEKAEQIKQWSLRFDWQQAGQQYIECYQQLLESRKQ